MCAYNAEAEREELRKRENGLYIVRQGCYEA